MLDEARSQVAVRERASSANCLIGFRSDQTVDPDVGQTGQVPG